MATKKNTAPTHYAVTLSEAFPAPGGLVVPAGRSIVAAEIAEQIPAAIQTTPKQPAEA